MTKAMLSIGFLLHVAAVFTTYAEAEVLLMARPVLALGGTVLFLVGCARFAKIIGYSGWFGLFGFLGIFGLGILCALPVKSDQSELPKKT